jgi:hypothetical protein
MRIATRARELAERDGAVLLFVGALMVYALTRLLWLERLPISFLGDEAIHATLGRRVFDTGLRGPDGSLLPVYFVNGFYWNLSLSVYLHGLTEAVFGASVQVARATNALVTVTGAVAVGLLAQTALGIRRGWLAILAFALAPGWLLLSRTALEAPLAVSLYAWALLAYAHYRNSSRAAALPAAFVFAAAAAYAYAPFQAIVPLTAVVLAVADRRHHARNLATVRWSLALALLLALPAMRFRLMHPDAAGDQLSTLGSYMTSSMSLPDKLVRLVERWGECLSPHYWYTGAGDLARHRWGDRGHLPFVLAPLLALGLLLAVRRARRDAGARLVLIALLAAPAGAALTDGRGATRLALVFVPTALLTALGADWLLERIRPLRARAATAAAVFVAGVAGAAGLLHEGLRDAPLWSRDYSLYGMQWGAIQLYEDVIPALMEREPAKIALSPTWANNTTQFGPFFLGDRVALDRLELHDERYWTVARNPIAPGGQIAILPPSELANLEASGIARVTQVGVLRYPDGSRGFEIVRVSPVTGAQRTSARR